jgi:surface polysaccharide O-acyltransferase-like enzyme
MNSSSDKAWVDYARVLAAFFVVVLHTSAPVAHGFNHLSPAAWWAGNLYDSMVRVSVPIFFMISGYLLLGRQEDVPVFLGKRLKKIAAPLYIWSLIYSLFKHFQNPKQAITPFFFIEPLFSPTYYHLWFLYVIFGLYLTIPLLNSMIANINPRTLHYFLGLWFFSSFVTAFLSKFFAITSAFDLSLVSGYGGYLVLGLVVGRLSISANWAICAVLIYFVGLLVTAGGTYLLTAGNHGQLDEYFYQNNAPNILLMSIAAFSLIKYAKENCSLLSTPKMKTLVAKGSAASFGIYLVHPLVLDLLHTHGIDKLSTNTLVAVPLTAFLAFALSWSITSVIRCIPILKRIVP